MARSFCFPGPTTPKTRKRRICPPYPLYLFLAPSTLWGVPITGMHSRHVGECIPVMVYSTLQYFSRKRGHKISRNFPHRPITTTTLHQRWEGVEGHPMQEMAQVRQGYAPQVSQEGRMGPCRHFQATRSAGDQLKPKVARRKDHPKTHANVSFRSHQHPTRMPMRSRCSPRPSKRL